MCCIFQYSLGYEEWYVNSNKMLTFFLSPCSRRKDITIALAEGFLFVIEACVFICRLR